MKTIGISAAGCVGRATAELIVNASSSYDMYELDISRFLGLHNNRKFLRDRVKEVPGKNRFFYNFKNDVTADVSQGY
jgi:pyruvate dehydrogenase phosphatase regulatory subunit